VPVNGVCADTHGREVKAIAEHPPCLHGPHRQLQFVLCRRRTIQQQVAVQRPKLSVAGHRLVIKFKIVGNAAEQDMHERMLAFEQFQFILVAEDFVPAMRSLVGVAH